MARQISEKDIKAAIDLIKEADNYCLITDKNVVLFNRDITPIKISYLEKLLKDCINKYIGTKAKES